MADLPQGLLFYPEFLSESQHNSLLSWVRVLPFRSFAMKGVTAKRRVYDFGWHYSFQDFRLTPAPPVPPELQDLRTRVAEVARVSAESFAEALVTKYQPGAGIGWHRDAPPFGLVAGISLGAPCRMRFQRGKGPERVTAALDLSPGSLYLLTGESRSKWEHTISPMKAHRYSITFRTLRRDQK